MIRPTKITIPWYRRNINKIGSLTNENNFTFDPFDPDIDKRRKRRKINPDPSPDPTPQPDGIRVGATQPNPNPIIVTIEGKQYVDDGVFLTPVIDIVQPSKDFKPGKATNKPTTNTNLPFPKLPDLSPKKPVLNVGVPGDEILLRLMEVDPTYSKFVKKYNDFTMELLWEIQNPFIVFEYPSYSQVKKLMKTFDITKMNHDDVRKYFKDQGVTGKNLTTAATRFFIYFETLKVGEQLENILVPPLNITDTTKHS